MPPVKKPKNKNNAKVSAADVTTTPVTTGVISGQLKKKLQARQNREKPQRGVVFIKHLPHGFFEDQIRRYFEQFGDVTRLRLARSKITGGSKGFAFVEFDVPEVAEVAAETMDNYLMFNKVVKATYIPPEKQQYNFFKTSVRKVKNKAGKPIYVSHKTSDINRRVKKFNDWSDEAYQKRTAVKQKRVKKLNQKYAHLGIDFSSIITGSQASDQTATENESLSDKKLEKKTGNKKTKSTPEEQTVKKSKKLIELEDLLGTTLDDDSDDDHDFELESENESGDDDEEKPPVTKKKRSEEVSLEDLLGDTLNDDSDDSEYELEANDDDEANEHEKMSSDEEPEETAESDDSSDEEKVQQNKKTKPANKKNKKTVKKVKANNLDELVKHKKLEGGIKKPKKDLLKKAKFGKPKNAMHTALTKELAQAMPSLKKSSKKQKK